MALSHCFLHASIGGRTRRFFLTALFLWTAVSPAFGSGERQWITYEGSSGPGLGKRIVLISGDEEYRSEEALPQLGKILARHHGFQCTVLFAIDPGTGIINPNRTDNIPGLEALRTADLMVLFTRFRALPDRQMQWIDEYLKKGKPVIGIRTATHAFNFSSPGSYSHYSNDYKGGFTAWRGGFGRLVLGEKWIRHHGHHKQESTCGVIDPSASEHPIVRGISNGDIWGPSDVYAVRLPLPGDSRSIVLGQVIKRRGEYDEQDPFYGMKPSDSDPNPEKNDPMMPIAWTKSFQLPGGRTGKAFTSTIGASTDLVSEGSRRLLVNAVYWILGLSDSIPENGTNVDLVGNYEYSAYGFRPDEYWKARRLKPLSLIHI